LRYAAIVKEKENAVDRRAAAGRCADCVHARQIKSARGSSFILCELSASNERFPKYPLLPVLACDGYKKSC